MNCLPTAISRQILLTFSMLTGLLSSRLIADTSTLQKCPHMSRDMRKNQVMPPRGVEMMLERIFLFFFSPLCSHYIHFCWQGNKENWTFWFNIFEGFFFLTFLSWGKFLRYEISSKYPVALSSRSHEIRLIACPKIFFFFFFYVVIASKAFSRSVLGWGDVQKNLLS